MGDEDNRRGDGGDTAPGIQFLNTFILMEDVLDKLKLLDYESLFCKEWGFKPFARFVTQKGLDLEPRPSVFI